MNQVEKCIAETKNLSFANNNLKLFPKILNPSILETLMISNNPIPNFEGMQTYPNLQQLDCSKTKISSFKGAKNQPSLKNVHLDGTPLSQSEHIVLMCIIVFGNSLEYVNSIKVMDYQIQFANQIRETINQHLVNGYLLLGTKPLAIVHSITHSRKTIFYDDAKATNTVDTNSKKVPNNTAQSLESSKGTKKVLKNKNSNHVESSKGDVDKIREKTVKKLPKEPLIHSNETYSLPNPEIKKPQGPKETKELEMEKDRGENPTSVSKSRIPKPPSRIPTAIKTKALDEDPKPTSSKVFQFSQKPIFKAAEKSKGALLKTNEITPTKPKLNCNDEGNSTPINMILSPNTRIVDFPLNPKPESIHNDIQKLSKRNKKSPSGIRRNSILTENMDISQIEQEPMSTPTKHYISPGRFNLYQKFSPSMSECSNSSIELSDIEFQPMPEYQSPKRTIVHFSPHSNSDGSFCVADLGLPLSFSDESQQAEDLACFGLSPLK